MKPGEPTLEELYQEARADLRIGGGDIALKWAFKHARARARLTRAEHATRVHDSERLGLRLEMHDRIEPAQRFEAFEALERCMASLAADAIDLADARAAETACEHVWQLAVKTPKQQAAAPARPATSATKPKAA